MTPRPKGPLRGIAALTIAGVWAIFVVSMFIVAALWLFGYGDYLQEIAR